MSLSMPGSARRVVQRGNGGGEALGPDTVTSGLSTEFPGVHGELAWSLCDESQNLFVTI
jgi:hypothetical protein